MLGYFTDPYPDELFASVLARLRERLHFASPQPFMAMFFGKKSQRPLIEFPTHLANIHAMLPPGNVYSADQWIDENSVYPFYAPFIDEARAQQVRVDMKLGEGGKVYLRLGLTRVPIPALTYLRFCPVCVQEDRMIYGETYWHRVHHILGIHACAKHAVWLEDSPVHARGTDGFQAAEPVIDEPEPRHLNPVNRFDQVQLRLAQEATWLLEHPSLPSNPALLAQKYLFCLAEQELAPYSGGNLYAQKLLGAVREYYGDELLDQLHCRLQTHPQNNWVARLCRRSETMSFPIYHLLLMHFLGYTAAGFFALPDQPAYFGRGPWPCLNAACDHFQKDVISDYELRFSQSSRRNPVGRFSCVCGFSYDRTGPDREEEDRYKITTVVQYGPVWERKFRELWEDPAVSKKQMAQQLNVSETAIANQANRLFVSTREHDLTRNAGHNMRGAGQEVNDANKRLMGDAYRIRLLEMRVEQPKATRNDLREGLKTEMAWLRKNDREWLEAYLPPRQYKNTAIGRPDPPPRQDWPVLDQQLAAAIPRAVDELLHQPGKPKRLSMKAIGQHLGKWNYFANHQNKLPRTRAALQAVVETREAHAVRRVEWVTACCLAEGHSARDWEIIKRAALRPETARLPAVRAAIETALERLRALKP
ncbi:MAG: TnsD family transposase [Anaerolineae bacterium]|nr:TnsD family transposase [Anaerolineae bacterium]